MRNLKKVLSLALALVMLLGMMVVGAGAAVTNFVDYGDKDAINEDYAEAVDLLTAIDVLSGTEGNFVPGGNLSRAEAAKLVATLALGVDAAKALTTAVAPFSDVPANNWAAGYVSYCANMGIVSGIGGGKFAPAGQVTGYQFAKMLLGVLGYGVNDEYKGPNWVLNVAADARKVHLDTKLVITNDALTREEAAQMAFNAINRPLVTWSPLLGAYTSESTQTVVGTTTLLGTLAGKIFRVAYVPDVDDLGYPTRYWKFVEKAGAITETYVTGTVLGTVTGGSVGEMYRSYAWEDFRTEIQSGSAVGVGGIKIYENGVRQTITSPTGTYELGQRADNTGDKTTPLGGNGGYFKASDMANKKGDAIGYKGQYIVIIDSDQGLLPGDGAADRMLVITNYLAEVTKVNEASNSANRSVEVKVYIPNEEGTVTTEFETEDYAKGDYVLVTPAYNDKVVTTLTDLTDVGKADLNKSFDTIALNAAAEYVTASVPAFYPINVNADVDTPKVQAEVTHDGSVSVNGSKLNYNGIFHTGYASKQYKGYDVALGQTYAQDGYVLTTATYNFYLDSFGNIIGVKVANDSIGNYAYIMDSGHDVFGDENYVKALLSDGTVGVYDVSSNSGYNYDGTKGTVAPDFVSDSRTIHDHADECVGHIYSYTLEGNVITLTALPATGVTSANGTSRHDNPVNIRADARQGTITEFKQGYTSITTSEGVWYATDETVFIYIDVANGNRIYRYVGKDNAPTLENGAKPVSIATEKVGSVTYARYVVIEGTPSVKNTTFLYITDGRVIGESRENSDGTGAKVYYYDAIVNGKKVVVATNRNNLNGATVYTYSYDSSKFVNGAEGQGYTVEPGVYNIDKNCGVDVAKGSVLVNASGSTLVLSSLKSPTDTGDVIFGGTTIVDAKSGAPVDELNMGDEIIVVYHTSNQKRYADTIYVTAQTTMVYGTDGVKDALKNAKDNDIITVTDLTGTLNLATYAAELANKKINLYVDGTVTNLDNLDAGAKLVAKGLAPAAAETINSGVTVQILSDVVVNSNVGITNNGTLIIDGDVDATATNALTITTATGKTTTINGTVGSPSAGTVNLITNGTLTVNGDIDGTVNKSGTGELILNGNVTDNHTLTITAGKLTLKGNITSTGKVVVDGSAVVVAMTGNVVSGGILDVDNAATVTVTGTVAGTLQVESGKAVTVVGTVTGTVEGAGTVTDKDGVVTPEEPAATPVVTGVTVNKVAATKVDDTHYTATIASIAKGATITAAATVTDGTAADATATVANTAANGETVELTLTVKNSKGETAATITVTVTLTAVTEASGSTTHAVAFAAATTDWKLSAATYTESTNSQTLTVTAAAAGAKTVTMTVAGVTGAEIKRTTEGKTAADATATAVDLSDGSITDWPNDGETVYYVKDASANESTKGAVKVGSDFYVPADTTQTFDPSGEYFTVTPAVEAATEQWTLTIPANANADLTITIQ